MILGSPHKYRQAWVCNTLHLNYKTLDSRVVKW